MRMNSFWFVEQVLCGSFCQHKESFWGDASAILICPKVSILYLSSRWYCFFLPLHTFHTIVNLRKGKIKVGGQEIGRHLKRKHSSRINSLALRYSTGRSTDPPFVKELWQGAGVGPECLSVCLSFQIPTLITGKSQYSDSNNMNIS